jgi:hypothetical protein
MDLFLKRVFLGEDYTIGKFSIDTVLFCDTLEDKVRDYDKDGDLDQAGETKIYGETAIPYGKYKVVLSYSPKFKRVLPEVLSVKGFTSIRIHAGTTAKDTLGCVLVGKNMIKGALYHSRITENALMVKLQAVKEDIFLTIV